MNNNRVTFPHNNELIMFIVYLMVLERHVRAAFWVLLQAMFMSDWNQTAQRLKLQEKLLTINKRNIIRWNIYRDKNFHSRRQVLKCLSKSWVSKLLKCFKPASRCLLLSKDELEARKSLKAFFYSQNYNKIFFETFSFYLRWENV